MSTSQHGLADGHKIGDGMIAIADELSYVSNGDTNSAVFILAEDITSCRLLDIRAC